MLAFFVGAGALAVVAGLTDTSGGDATSAAVETAFDRGFGAGEREAEANAEQEAQFRSVVAAAESEGPDAGFGKDWPSQPRGRFPSSRSRQGKMQL